MIWGHTRADFFHLLKSTPAVQKLSQKGKHQACIQRFNGCWGPKASNMGLAWGSNNLLQNSWFRFVHEEFTFGFDNSLDFWVPSWLWKLKAAKLFHRKPHWTRRNLWFWFVKPAWSAFLASSCNYNLAAGSVDTSLAVNFESGTNLWGHENLWN